MKVILFGLRGCSKDALCKCVLDGGANGLLAIDLAIGRIPQD